MLQLNDIGIMFIKIYTYKFKIYYNLNDLYLNLMFNNIYI